MRVTSTQTEGPGAGPDIKPDRLLSSPVTDDLDAGVLHSTPVTPALPACGRPRCLIITWKDTLTHRGLSVGDHYSLNIAVASSATNERWWL